MPVSAVVGLVHVALSACTDRRVSCGRPLTVGPDQAAQGVAPARPGPWLPYRPTGKRLGRPLLLQSGAAVPSVPIRPGSGSCTRRLMTIHDQVVSSGSI